MYLTLLISLLSKFLFLLLKTLKYFDMAAITLGAILGALGSSAVSSAFGFAQQNKANASNVAMQRETNALNYKIFQETQAYNSPVNQVNLLA